MTTQQKPWKTKPLIKQTALATILLLSPTPSRAKPEDDPTPLATGDSAPFTGILLPTSDAVALWQKIEVLEGKLKLEEQRCTELRAVDEEKCDKQVSVMRQTRDEQVALLKAQLAQCEVEKQRQWYEDPLLLMGTGAVAGAVLGIGVIWLGAQFRP